MTLKKIDIHLHVVLEPMGALPNGMYCSHCGEMKEYMDNNNVEMGLLMSGGEGEDVLLGGNDEVRAIAERYPDTFAWLCNIDAMDSENLEERILKYKSQGAKGVGEFMTNLRIDDSRIDAVFAACEKADMPILFHMSPKENYNYGIVDEPGLPLLEKALKKYPNLKFIGHSQPFWYEISGDASTDFEARNEYPTGKVVPGGRTPELFDKYPNLYGDLSANSAGNALMRDPEFGYEFIEKNQDRLMFATDMVNVNMSFPLGKWLDEAVVAGKISEEAYRKVCRENAIRVFGLRASL